jgi:hypothetical protein
MGDFQKDIRFWLLLGAGVVAAAWAFRYASDVNSLVQTGTNGYVSMVQGLEPPGSGGVGGGAGNFQGNPGGTYYHAYPGA